MAQRSTVLERPVPRPALEAPWRLDLLRFRPLRWLVRQRWLQFALILPNLFIFTLVILTGFLGTPIGAKNFAIIFVWIVWWALLILVLVPFGARSWCAMCPIPAAGEWLQRRAFILWRPRTFGLNRKWPKGLRNLWVANFGFASIALTSAVLTTRPVVTGTVLLGLVLIAVATHLVFERRTFCRYLCPVGGFLGLYSMAAPVEVRRVDAEVCRRCQFKACFRGSSEASLQVGGVGGYGCPNFEFPGAPMERNTYCLLCTECIKACPYENITIRTRPFFQDLLVEKGRKLDEAYKSFIMLGAAVMYSIVMPGPWGWIKDWANFSSPTGALLYALIFLGSILLAAPALHLAFTWLSRLLAGAQGLSVKKLFVDYAYALVPLGLAGWIAFSFSFVLPNISYAVSVLSDPFGWGWDLFGTKGYPWTPYAPHLLPYIQVPVLLLGLTLSIRIGYGLARQNFPALQQARRALVPLSAYLTGVTALFLVLYLG